MLKTAAFFDVDGTLFKTNVIAHYLNLTIPYISPLRRWLLWGKIASQIPYYILLDLRDRQKFNRVFYRNYRHFPIAELAKRSEVYLQTKLQYRIFSSAKKCIAKHKEREHLIVLVTGSLNCIIIPLAKLIDADAIIATKLQIEGDTCTGEIAEPTPIGEEKARRINLLASELSLDLENSHAYGDSVSDLPMLMTVGNPVVINPDRQFKKIARQKQWSIKHWN